MAALNLLPYAPEWAERWDRFVMEETQNGTFLQTRRFLSYHPEGRFQDASLMVAMDNGELVAVVPAAECEVEGELWYRAHPGSTFGGIVLSKRLLQADKVIALVQALDGRLCQRYRACELKITPALFAARPTELLEYALFYCDYAQETEISAYVPMAGQTPETLRARYSATKRYELKRAEAQGLTAAWLNGEAELTAFYDLLSLNMQKFNTVPVHTLAELTDFARARLREEIRFLGVRDASGALVAGACLFSFAQTRTLHTQYLASDTRLGGYSPSAFLYDQVLRAGLELHASQVSLGTSTFRHGHVLNIGLIQNKEGFGCEHSLNRLFTKRYR